MEPVSTLPWGSIVVVYRIRCRTGNSRGRKAALIHSNNPQRKTADMFKVDYQVGAQEQAFGRAHYLKIASVAATTTSSNSSSCINTSYLASCPLKLAASQASVRVRFRPWVETRADPCAESFAHSLTLS